ncbi:PfkB family carbohydrate kinase (plasmid) [Rhizobium sp. CB3060]|uniref:PfkB family carbohydrate kinase n=1 Tax=Rhizobium sp. CB3060 TaxID=3138255 RepID=UPI0021A50B8D|nr:PfkB family carbohydrate kinase [Rhizobium tropici]UWU25443.1 PfkB family carbohydrate kinase [Rhizobium tropici]
MIVVGGVYREVCQYPYWDRLFGSGLRAAAAVSELSPGTSLYAYAPRAWMDDIISSAAAFMVRAEITEFGRGIVFDYFHPLSAAAIDGAGAKAAPIKVDGDVVLRFGMIEGDAVVHAKHAVYDPQTGVSPEPFRESGSTAEHLAIVLNGWEAEQATGLPPHEAGELIMARENAEAVIVKLGPQGAIVHAPGQAAILVPPHNADSVFKIGSGDVFSAAFAHYWAEAFESPAKAAELASRSVAHFVDGHRLPLPPPAQLQHGDALKPRDRARQVYLAGPFFTIAQRWLVEETRDILSAMHIPVFSPLHDVGTAKRPDELAGLDLVGLEESSVVLALIDGADPGTLFEVGYARKSGIPVVVLTEQMASSNLTMFEGTGCVVAHDYTTAIYKTAFEAWSA